MLFTRQNGFYRVDRVTGPKHNLLSVTLVSELMTPPQVEALPGFCHGHDELDPSAILAHVLEGLVLANQRFGTDYSVSLVRYRLGDTPPELVYGVLLFKIVEQLVSGGVFVETNPGVE